ncbi:putative serine esterase-domain-containing protein [Amylostereum chailletii]|nr:putative serine esterase-domain-containing protein [Amylostereum chailletii]
MPNQVHLLVLIHGMWGHPGHLAEMHRIIDEIRVRPSLQNAEGDELLAILPETNREESTYDGIDWGGERVAKEARSISRSSFFSSNHILPFSRQIYEEVAKIEQGGKKVVKFSVIGYSLGGLILVMSILHQRQFFNTITPVNFNTIATPHIGLLVFPTMFSRLAGYFGPKILSRTGEQLYTTDKWSERGRPLLEVMADPNRIFYQGLSMFPHIRIYANARLGDSMDVCFRRLDVSGGSGVPDIRAGLAKHAAIDENTVGASVRVLRTSELLEAVLHFLSIPSITCVKHSCRLFAAQTDLQVSFRPGHFPRHSPQHWVHRFRIDGICFRHVRHCLHDHTGPHDMDDFPAAGATTVVDFLVHGEQYSFLPHTLSDDNNHFMSYQGGTAAIIHLARSDGVCIDVVCISVPSAGFPLPHFWGTLVVNSLTADSLHVAYPQLTFDGIGCVNPSRAMQLTTMYCAQKYTIRGFDIRTFSEVDSRCGPGQSRRNANCPHTTRASR